jgi:mannose-6-phosphate isomerase-like protein (cupin superfamily)
MSPPNLETNSPFSLLGNSLLVRAKEGRTLRAFGHAIAVPLDGEQTGGKFTAFLNMTPPGGGPGPHYHEREDEWFYVVEGRVSFLMNGTWTDLFPAIAFILPAARSMVSKTIRISQSVYSSILLPPDLNISSPK